MQQRSESQSADFEFDWVDANATPAMQQVRLPLTGTIVAGLDAAEPTVVPIQTDGQDQAAISVDGEQAQEIPIHPASITGNFDGVSYDFARTAYDFFARPEMEASPSLEMLQGASATVETETSMAGDVPAETEATKGDLPPAVAVAVAQASDRPSTPPVAAPNLTRISNPQYRVSARKGEASAKDCSGKEMSSNPPANDIYPSIEIPASQSEASTKKAEATAAVVANNVVEQAQMLASASATTYMPIEMAASRPSVSEEGSTSLQVAVEPTQSRIAVTAPNAVPVQNRKAPMASITAMDETAVFTTTTDGPAISHVAAVGQPTTQPSPSKVTLGAKAAGNADADDAHPTTSFRADSAPSMLLDTAIPGNRVAADRRAVKYESTAISSPAIESQANTVTSESSESSPIMGGLPRNADFPTPTAPVETTRRMGANDGVAPAVGDSQARISSVPVSSAARLMLSSQQGATNVQMTAQTSAPVGNEVGIDLLRSSETVSKPVPVTGGNARVAERTASTTFTGFAPAAMPAGVSAAAVVQETKLSAGKAQSSTQPAESETPFAAEASVTSADTEALPLATVYTAPQDYAPLARPAQPLITQRSTASSIHTSGGQVFAENIGMIGEKPEAEAKTSVIARQAPEAGDADSLTRAVELPAPVVLSDGTLRRFVQNPLTQVASTKTPPVSQSLTSKTAQANESPAAATTQAWVSASATGEEATVIADALRSAGFAISQTAQENAATDDAVLQPAQLTPRTLASPSSLAKPAGMALPNSSTPVSVGAVQSASRNSGNIRQIVSSTVSQEPVSLSPQSQSSVSNSSQQVSLDPAAFPTQSAAIPASDMIAAPSAPATETAASTTAVNLDAKAANLAPLSARALRASVMAPQVSNKRNSQKVDGKKEAKSGTTDGILVASKPAIMANDDRNNLPLSNTGEMPSVAVMAADRSAKADFSRQMDRPESSLHESVSRTMNVVKEVAEKLQTKSERTVDFDLNFRSGEHLTVSLEFRRGEVHTTFRTNSVELRDTLSREWQATMPAMLQGKESVRLSEPTFTQGSSAVRNDATNLDGQAARQNQQQARDQGSQESARGFSFSRQSHNNAVDKSEPVATPRALVLDGSRRLHTFA
jgi:hypothetical protein